MKNFSMICAVSLDGIIGDSLTNTIPWYLPSDLKWFKEKTLNKTVIMGSRTFESIGKILPNRRNVVITRNLSGEALHLEKAGVDECYNSIQDALRNELRYPIVIGGQHIYGEALKHYPSSLFITIVKLLPEGDIRFPIAGRRFMQDEVIVNESLRYKCVNRSDWKEENGIEYQFTEFR